MASHSTMLAAAEQLELLAAEMYRLLAERFAARETVRALFWRLHQEEVQHATRMRLLASQYRADPWLFGSAAMFDGAPDPRKMILEVEAAVRELQAGTWGGDLSQVRARLLEMEKRCVSIHAQFVAAGAATEVSSFFEELARQDEEHERLLGDL